MEIIPIPNSGKLLLLAAPRSVLKSALPPWIARLAAAGPLMVLDGGNCFNAYGVARDLRRRTPHVTDALKRISVARAFTCYQMAALLSETSNSALPILTLDLLATFADENVRLDERKRLLAGCVNQLRRLSATAPAAISVSLRSVLDTDLLAMVEDAAGQVWRLEEPLPLPEAPRLL